MKESVVYSRGVQFNEDLGHHSIVGFSGDCESDQAPTESWYPNEPALEQVDQQEKGIDQIFYGITIFWS